MKGGLALLALAGTLAMAPVRAEPPIVIKFSHVVATDTPKGRAAEFFKQRAEALTQGRVRVEVHANSSLYKDKEEIEALQLGAVQMLAPTLSKFGRLGVGEFEVFDLPYLFDGLDAVHKLTRGPIGAALLKKLEARQLAGLAFWDNGFKPLSANRPLRTPADLKGLKMRIAPSRVLEAQMRALGALPQVMALSEVYPALKTGALDGTENVVSNFHTQKMHEVQKHLTLTGHGYVGYVLVANKKFWDGLPAEVRKQLDQAVREATQQANALAAAENDKALEAVRSSGRTQVAVLTPQQKTLWKQVLLPVHRDMEARIGRDLLQAIYRDTGFEPAKL
jgi:C4-dicarboxylate-binding protein DctP